MLSLWAKITKCVKTYKLDACLRGREPPQEAFDEDLNSEILT